MSRKTKEQKKVLTGLSVLFQGLVRCFDTGMPEKKAWQQALSNALVEELTKQNIKEEDWIFFKHYVLCLVQIYLSQELSFSDFKKHAQNIELQENLEISDRDISRVAEHDKNFMLAFFLAMIEKAMEIKGVDVLVAHKVAKKIIEGRVLEQNEGHFLIDLPLNSYFFGDPGCALKYLSSAFSENLFQASRINISDLRFNNIEPVIALALYKELNNILRATITQPYISKSKTDIPMKAWLKVGEGGESIDFVKSEIRFNVSDLKIKTYRDLAHEIIDLQISSDRNIKVQLIPQYIIDNGFFLEFLEYAIDGLTYDFFEDELASIRLDKVISIVSGQFMNIFISNYSDGLEVSKIYSNEGAEIGGGPTSISDLISKDYLRYRNGIFLSPKVIYREFLNSKNKYFPLIAKKWCNLVDDERFSKNEGWLLKQLVVGNMEYMEMA